MRVINSTTTIKSIGIECSFPVAEVSKFPAKTKGAPCLDGEVINTKTARRSLGTRRRRVAFNEVVVVRRINFTSDNSTDGINNIWYRKPEYRRMRREMTNTISRMERGTHEFDTEEHCARGLENRLPKKAKERKQRKLLSILSVLVEQEEQMDHDIYNPEAVAEIYFQCSSVGREEAAMRGKVDAVEATKFHTGDDNLDSPGAKTMRARSRNMSYLKSVLAKLQSRKD